MTRDPTEIGIEPRLPRSAKALPAAFTQTLQAPEGRTAVAALTWAHLPAHVGVYQLCHVHVREQDRREGRGTALLEAATDQMARHARLVGLPLRRLIVLVNQPDVILRAWLSQKGGFVHVHTLENVEEATDVMVMQRTFD